MGTYGSRWTTAGVAQAEEHLSCKQKSGVSTTPTGSKKDTMDKFVIDRSKWLRGEGPKGFSVLLRRSDRKMCCLGFYGEHLGVSRRKLIDIGNPPVIKRFGELAPALVSTHDKSCNSSVCDQIIRVNDSQEISDKMREYRLKRLFKSIGVNVEFV